MRTRGEMICKPACDIHVTARDPKPTSFVESRTQRGENLGMEGVEDKAAPQALSGRLTRREPAAPSSAPPGRTEGAATQRRPPMRPRCGLAARGSLARLRRSTYCDAPRQRTASRAQARNCQHCGPWLRRGGHTTCATRGGISERPRGSAPHPRPAIPPGLGLGRQGLGLDALGELLGAPGSEASTRPRVSAAVGPCGAPWHPPKASPPQRRRGGHRSADRGRRPKQRLARLSRPAGAGRLQGTHHDSCHATLPKTSTPAGFGLQLAEANANSGGVYRAQLAFDAPKQTPSFRGAVPRGAADVHAKLGPKERHACNGTEALAPTMPVPRKHARPRC